MGAAMTRRKWDASMWRGRWRSTPGPRVNDEKNPEQARGSRLQRTTDVTCYQNCRLHLSMRPVSPLALSLTRSFQVPLATSDDALMVKVPITLSVLDPVRLWMLYSVPSGATRSRKSAGTGKRVSVIVDLGGR